MINRDILINMFFNLCVTMDNRKRYMIVKYQILRNQWDVFKQGIGQIRILNNNIDNYEIILFPTIECSKKYNLSGKLQYKISDRTYYNLKRLYFGKYTKYYNEHSFIEKLIKEIFN